jgi:hypothetical protein
MEEDADRFLIGHSSIRLLLLGLVGTLLLSSCYWTPESGAPGAVLLDIHLGSVDRALAKPKPKEEPTQARIVLSSVGDVITDDVFPLSKGQNSITLEVRSETEYEVLLELLDSSFKVLRSGESPPFTVRAGKTTVVNIELT